ncbi:MAG TPA: hypothetical protein DEA08_04945 [Planctomycetes bacterium]|nr:hypothetical protein [Planctomycetota bacterium]
MHEFNQEHGHAEGDLALTRIAESLRELVGDRAVRTSGDEWLVAWEGEAPAGRARALVAAQVGEGPPTISVALDQRPGPLEERLRRLELAILPREGPRAAQVILVE